MCELLVLAAPDRFPLKLVVQAAIELERHGEAGHGWGIAWLPAAGAPLRLFKSPRDLAEDPAAGALGDERAILALVHLRMPTDMSTVGMPDTQPFLNEQLGIAFAHNGYLAHHQEVRPRYTAVLAGRADSEVGFAHLCALLPALGMEPALRTMFQETGGERGFGNLVVLEQAGTAHIYCANPGNRVCALSQGALAGFVTMLHREDGIAALSTIFPRADFSLVPVGEIRTVSVLPGG